MVQLRRPELRPGPPGPADAGHVLRRARPRPGLRAAHPHLAGAGPLACSSASVPDLRRLPRQGVPHRRAGRHAHPGVPPGRGPGRRRGPDHGAPQRHAGPLRRRDVRRGPRPGCARRTSRSPSPAPRWTCAASSAGGVGTRPPAAPAAARAGSSGAAAAWSTRNVLRACGVDPEPLQRLRVRHGHRADADVPQRRGGHARHGRGRRAVQPARSGWRSDARPAVLAARVRRPAGGRRPAGDVPAALVRVGLEEEARARRRRHRARSSSARCCRVEEPQTNGKTIRWCQVDVGPPTAPATTPQGIVCGAHNFAVGDKVVVVAARRRAARRLRDRRAQDLRPRLATA